MFHDIPRSTSTSPLPNESLTVARISKYRRTLLRSSDSAEIIMSHCFPLPSQPSSESSAAIRIVPCCEAGSHLLQDMDQDLDRDNTLLSFAERLKQDSDSNSPPLTTAESMQPSLDNQPRQSASISSLRAINNRTSSVRSTGSRSGVYRHSLLKTDNSHQQSVEKDLPVPPLLTQDTSRSTGAGPEGVPGSRTASIFTERPTPAIEESRKPGIVCVDPSLHPPGTHNKIHHPGLVSGADFCDFGLPDERNYAVRASSGISSRSEPARNFLLGRVYRALVGQNSCEEVIGASEHVHYGHSSTMKVRPALGEYIGDHSHEGHSTVSKVRPATEDIQDKMAIGEGRPSFHQTAEPGGLDPVEDNVHSNQIHSPKVLPYSDHSLADSSLNPYTRNNHEGLVRVDKVQSYHSGAALAHATEENSIPGLVIQPQEEHSEHAKDPSRAALYWGFFPASGNKDEEIQVDDRSGTHPDTQRKSLESIGKGHLGHKDEQATRLSPNLDALEDRFSVHDQANTHRESSISSLQKIPLLPNDNQDQHRQSSLPDKLDPRRTATWLRQLLGYPEPRSSTLTKLPEKLHPRHQAHEDYPKDEVNSILSRVTTFSRQDAVDAGAMNDAMQNLEQLLNEALDLANTVTEKENCGHVDDGNLYTHREGTSEDVERSSYPPSVHESVLNSSIDDEHNNLLTKTPPTAFVGAVETSSHGCEALSLRSMERRISTKPDMHSGNVRGVAFPAKELSMHSLRTPVCKSIANGNSTIHHVPDDSCILPMPPPDRRLKRKYTEALPQAYDEDDPSGVIKPRTKHVPNSREVREYIRVFHQPPIAPRKSSRNLRENMTTKKRGSHSRRNRRAGNRRRDVDVCSLDGGTSDDIVDFSTQYHNDEEQDTGYSGFRGSSRTHANNASAANTGVSQRQPSSQRAHELHEVNLRRRSHVSIKEGQQFSLTKSVQRHPTIARDWSPTRKRLVATVACISTALIGSLIGIYAGLVPSIQYYIADFNHYSIIGNVGLFLGLALSTFFCWPLPLLHGRKPYIVCSLCVAMPLLFPQAIAVSSPRSPYTSAWRWALLLPRALMGCALGFASMNFHSILTDLFGASLMSSNPHQEVVDQYDVRRHGGGLGVWLGIWTWCFIGSLAVGFLIGAVVIDTLPPSWGLYISIMLIAVVLLLNVLCPEVRRSAWRRSVAEVRTGTTVSRRVARGEIMMHRIQDGPKWWGQELYHGAALSLEMLRQPGFAVMALYSAWIYAQVVLIIVLLGSLTSRVYRMRSPYVGAAVSSVAIGALAAVPFQKANIFSRARNMGPLTNSMTFDRKITWTSHLVRRAIFTLVLPIGGILYTVVSYGPPFHVFFPCFFAAVIGFLSCLAIAECNGLLMETWDCSDLQPGMTGHPKPGKDSKKRTNYSSFPRVTAGWNTVQSIGFIFAAGATGIGGIATRSLGQRTATGVVASILLLFSLLLLTILARFRKVQIIPRSKTMEMDKWTAERRSSLRRRATAIAVAKANGLRDMPQIPEDDIG
ncbi:hypothetical protein F4775DRAFT_444682 [Biscogniauxia sp. FL1348]|nr:hypothetical protein F4775DRAFT_444682 [Biscogniauxia sp. FL1348]